MPLFTGGNNATAMFSGAGGTGYRNGLAAVAWMAAFWLILFKPACSDCAECTPIRIRLNKHHLSKSRRRIIRKNVSTQFQVSPRVFNERIFTLYQHHSRDRFHKDSSKQEFIESFFKQSGDGLLTLYYYSGVLGAAGFLDKSTHALSSAYFVWDNSYRYLAPGIYSVLREVEWGREQMLDYYYLGYYVKDCSSMNYKASILPCQLFDWQTEQWYDMVQNV